MKDFFVATGVLASLLVTVALVYIAALLFARWLMKFKRHWGAPEHPSFWRSELAVQKITHAGVEGPWKTTWGEHPILQVFGLSDAVQGRWFFGLLRLDKKNRLVMDQTPIPRLRNAGRYLAEGNDGSLHYLNHANTWQACPNFITQKDTGLGGKSTRLNREILVALPYLIHCARQRWGDGFVYSEEDCVKRWEDGQFERDYAEHVAKSKMSAAGTGQSAGAPEPAEQGAGRHRPAPAPACFPDSMQWCQCESPTIRCDGHGCRCTFCGLPDGPKPAKAKGYISADNGQGMGLPEKCVKHGCGGKLIYKSPVPYADGDNVCEKCGCSYGAD